MFDTISTILQSAAAFLSLTAIAWLTIMLPASLALANRRGIHLGWGALSAVLPIIGWLGLFYISRGSRTHPTSRSTNTFDDDLDY